MRFWSTAPLGGMSTSHSTPNSFSAARTPAAAVFQKRVHAVGDVGEFSFSCRRRVWNPFQFEDAVGVGRFCCTR